ncbi:MAG: hypothetical protein KGI68_05535 [Alphaproteobacteria bacterium]|nr:hypothetical protein [Alphaproteobacteria bacterium]MDE1985917.1 hypothetical protein [Alphaproteobacteria bacterium]MDE2266486.1 hypothetical protein [Alphaproteobacteria bacterium]MDE2500651.1 hypothetical protein [Alphaproteobacteria bacterium]
MDYQTAENQVVQLQQQADQAAQGIKALADKLQSKITDANLARELTLDLREAALAIQQQNQSTVALIEQMAQYIHSLENHAVSVPQVNYQPRGWANQSFGGGGGFMSNVMSGLGMGAGFGLANDIVGGLFGGL